ncbi:MAG TPA: hypothetical protein VGE41_09020 [Verrucomicrobiae bacterium]
MKAHFAHDQTVLAVPAKVIRAVHEGLNKEKPAAAFVLRTWQIDVFRHFETGCVIVHMEFDLGTGADQKDFDWLMPAELCGVLDCIVASFRQRQFAGGDLLFVELLLFKKAARGDAGGANLPEVAGK